MQLTTIQSHENAQAEKLKNEQNLYIVEDETYLSIWDFDIVSSPVIRYSVELDGTYLLMWSDYIIDDKYNTMENINILPALLNDIKRAL